MVNEPTLLVPRALLRKHAPRLIWFLKSIAISIVVSVLVYAVTPRPVLVYLRLHKPKPTVTVRGIPKPAPCTFRQIDLETGAERCFR
jgi:hypothetical protein